MSALGGKPKVPQSGAERRAGARARPPTLLTRTGLTALMFADKRKDSLVVCVRRFCRHGVRTSGNDDPLAVW